LHTYTNEGEIICRCTIEEVSPSKYEESLTSSSVAIADNSPSPATRLRASSPSLSHYCVRASLDEARAQRKGTSGNLSIASPQENSPSTCSRSALYIMWSRTIDDRFFARPVEITCASEGEALPPHRYHFVNLKIEHQQDHEGIA